MNKSMTHPAHHIRLLESPEELEQVVALQRIVWPGSDLEIVPSHILLTAAHNGGLVAGAYIDDQLTGFVFSFLGFQPAEPGRRLKHCSHMLGVHPDCRGAGIGFALKRFQRERVLSQGLDLVTWTYDPLLARNARLNIAKLGAVCNTYLPDLYGELRDGLNAGLPTDRFQVDWWIAHDRVAARVGQESGARPGLADLLDAGAHLVNPPVGPDQPASPPGDIRDAKDQSAVLIEIPSDFPALKAADPALALRWRLATRQAFRALFEQGLAVTDFVSQAGPRSRAAYVLTHELTARHSCNS